MEDNVKSFLDKIQELKERKIKVDVISTGKSIDCSPLTFKQQKDLISTIADGASGALKFQKYLNDIVTSNSNNLELKSIDKLPIILKLRVDSIGSKIKIGDSEGDITPILEKVKKLKFEKIKNIKGDIEIQLEVPTLTQESKVIQSTLDSIKKEDTEFGKNVGNIYTYEIVKYIKTISFQEQELVFSDIPVKDRFKIVENLPLSTNKEIISFIQDIKKKETELLVVSIDGEDKYFDIDVSFFDS